MAYDIFGYNSGRINEICDYFGELGLNIYQPDFYRGEFCDLFDPKTKPGDAAKFIKKFSFQGIQSDLDRTLLLIKKENAHIKTMGILGFCWGALPVFLACQTPSFSYGVSFHPSLGVTKLFDVDPVEFGAKVVAPQLTILSKQEEDFYREGGALYVKLKEKFGDSYEIHEYDENHGFVSRCKTDKSFENSNKAIQ